MCFSEISGEKNDDDKRWKQKKLNNEITSQIFYLNLTLLNSEFKENYL